MIVLSLRMRLPKTDKSRLVGGRGPFVWCQARSRYLAVQSLFRLFGVAFALYGRSSPVSSGAGIPCTVSCNR